MNEKLKKLGFALILGPIAPLVGLLIGWFGATLLSLAERWIALATLTGLLLGIVADIFLLKGLVTRASQLSPAFWVAVYLFYTLGVFGMFMGVPVFNAALAIPAGFVVGAKLATENADKQRVRKAAGRTAWFTTGVLALICIASAVLALASPSTPHDLQGMLKLGFEVTQAMVVGLILVGGAALLAVGWGLAVAAVRFTYAFFQHKV